MKWENETWSYGIKKQHLIIHSELLNKTKRTEVSNCQNKCYLALILKDFTKEGDLIGHVQVASYSLNSRLPSTNDNI
jgi:hypothetical protein